MGACAGGPAGSVLKEFCGEKKKKKLLCAHAHAPPLCDNQLTRAPARRGGRAWTLCPPEQERESRRAPNWENEKTKKEKKEKTRRPQPSIPPLSSPLLSFPLHILAALVMPRAPIVSRAGRGTSARRTPAEISSLIDISRAAARMDWTSFGRSPA